jgi:hypothetical protein
MKTASLIFLVGGLAIQTGAVMAQASPAKPSSPQFAGQPTYLVADAPASEQPDCGLHGQAFYSKTARAPGHDRIAPPAIGGTPATDAPSWKTISIGTHENVGTLIEALGRKRCRIGPNVAEILDHPNFNISKSRARVQLAALSVTQLGFQGKTASLAEIYARATKLGYELCPAEIGAQLRLQYMNQPLGEFLHIAMQPLQTQRGRPLILAVANGGEGLLLISSDGNPDFRPPLTTRFVFVKPQAVAAR